MEETMWCQSWRQCDITHGDSVTSPMATVWHHPWRQCDITHGDSVTSPMETVWHHWYMSVTWHLIKTRRVLRPVTWTQTVNNIRCSHCSSIQGPHICDNGRWTHHSCVHVDELFFKLIFLFNTYRRQPLIYEKKPVYNWYHIPNTQYDIDMYNMIIWVNSLKMTIEYIKKNVYCSSCNEKSGPVFISWKSAN